jgi:hypothetical protein
MRVAWSKSEVSGSKWVEAFLDLDFFVLFHQWKKNKPVRLLRTTTSMEKEQARPASEDKI